jgi:PTS system nitrogen regulatory IIA component
MKISDFLKPSDVIADLAGTTAQAVLAELCGLVAHAGPQAGLIDAQILLDTLLAREQLGSTGIGDGVAIPHGRVPGLPSLRAALGRSRAGIDFKAADDKPTHIFVALFAPASGPGLHLHALARLSRVFKDPALRDAVMQARDAAEIYQRIDAEDAKP